MSFDVNVDEVCQLFQDRSWVGYKKYGVTTERTDINLVGWLTHLQEELMDATIYIQRIKKEAALLELARIDQELFGKDHYVHSDTNNGEFSGASAKQDVPFLRSDAPVDSPLPAGVHWGMASCDAPAHVPAPPFQHQD